MRNGSSLNRIVQSCPRSLESRLDHRIPLHAGLLVELLEYWTMRISLPHRKLIPKQALSILKALYLVNN